MTDRRGRDVPIPKTRDRVPRLDLRGVQGLLVVSYAAFCGGVPLGAATARGRLAEVTAVLGEGLRPGGRDRAVCSGSLAGLRGELDVGGRRLPMGRGN